jgi:hypothetical protein
MIACKRTSFWTGGFVALMMLSGGAHGTDLGTAFTYQGRLVKDGSPLNANCDFTFGLWNAAADGAQEGNSPQGPMTVPVSNGLFTVSLNFGPEAITGEARWLEITVQCPGDITATTLAPRQELKPAPHALALPGLYTMQTGASPNIIGGYSGNSASPVFLGATIGGGGNSLAPQMAVGDYATVGGGLGNTASATASTVGGGSTNEALGNYSTVSGGNENDAGGNQATVGGGGDNSASGDKSAIGGGFSNEANGTGSTVAGGQNNLAAGDNAVVGGGIDNEASGLDATIGGGSTNRAIGWLATVSGGNGNVADGQQSAICGGAKNHASGVESGIGGGQNNETTGDYAGITGGYFNTASGLESTVGGGHNNIASGVAATIPGGGSNLAGGNYSLAAGYRARVQLGHHGTFIWADVTEADFTSTGLNQFLIRANGGVGIGTNAPLHPLHMGSGAHVTAGGVWTNASDRSMKENFASVDVRAVLEAVGDLPIATWNYKNEESAIRHMGPVAQDFVAAFGLGGDDRTIATIDAEGVALAAIQGLHQIVKEKDCRIDELEVKLASLEAVVAKLAEQSNGGGR